MMRRAYLDAPLAISPAAGSASHVPAGPIWVLERTHWSALIWTGDDGRMKVELPARDYALHVADGRIRFAVETESIF
jgi:hypothetical protein